MLDALLKIKPDAVAATWYLTAAAHALLLGKDRATSVRQGRI